jgi:hypothetical protein
MRIGVRAAPIEPTIKNFLISTLEIPMFPEEVLHIRKNKIGKGKKLR